MASDWLTTLLSANEKLQYKYWLVNGLLRVTHSVFINDVALILFVPAIVQLVLFRNVTNIDILESQTARHFLTQGALARTRSTYSSEMELFIGI